MVTRGERRETRPNGPGRDGIWVRKTDRGSLRFSVLLFVSHIRGLSFTPLRFLCPSVVSCPPCTRLSATLRSRSLRSLVSDGMEERREPKRRQTDETRRWTVGTETTEDDKKRRCSGCTRVSRSLPILLSTAASTPGGLRYTHLRLVSLGLRREWNEERTEVNDERQKRRRDEWQGLSRKVTNKCK